MIMTGVGHVVPFVIFIFIIVSGTHHLRLGFCIAIQYILRMRPGSLLWSGLPCSLHIWISRGTHHKSRANPRGVVPGKVMYKCVEQANLVACRFGMIALLCLVRQIWWNTEQPGGSVAQWLPYLEVALHPDRTILGWIPEQLDPKIVPWLSGIYFLVNYDGVMLLQSY